MKNSRLKGDLGKFKGQGFLHSSNCYVILYKYGPNMKNHIGKCFICLLYELHQDLPRDEVYLISDVAVYYWQGEMTSSDVRAACALQAFRKEHEVSNHGRRSGLFPV